MSRNIALLLEYDGSCFHGWQSQVNADAVQDRVAEAVGQLEKRTMKVTGASRTDAGVHATGQVAHFITESAIPDLKYSFALNSILPEGVTCIGSKEAPPDFHARFSAIGKRYVYQILNRRLPSALLRNRVWHVPITLDIEAMRSASAILVGEHDFRAFMAAGSPVKSTVRTIHSLDINISDEHMLSLRVCGNGFLYNMVRIIAGTLVYVGQGKLGCDDVRALLAAEGAKRENAGKTAPPQGLCLEHVFYPDFSFDDPST